MQNIIDVNIYKGIRETVLTAKNKVYVAVNFTMVEAYWNIGKQIAEVQGERTAYGKQLPKYVSEQLTAEFGAGFDQRNLRYMRQFYVSFPIWNTLYSELTWSHYRLLIDTLFSDVYVLNTWCYFNV